MLSVKAVGIQKTHSRSGEKGDFILYFLPNIPVLTFNRAEFDGEPTSSG